MNLIIVESPTKARTLQGFLGPGYRVRSSFGHVRDLPERELAVDIENDFKPKYVIIPKAKKIIAELKEKVQKAKETILATDEDREGEAIAFHLSQALDLKNPQRIVFHEITKKAIDEALQSPRGIDLNLVNSQQARRILDRLVGYKLSPLLWKKVARGLSAGRVQSVAVRLVAERQKEIDEFKPEEYWTIDAEFKKGFTARLVKKIKTKKETDEIIKDLKVAEYRVKNIEKKETKKYPFPPFTTSTLQQEANRKLKFSAKQTMFIAQQLYEGVVLENKKSVGLITYMRTDSLNLAGQAIFKIRNVIEKNFSKKYLPLRPIFYKTKSKTAQEAHEAIRPTFPEKNPEDIKEFLNKNQFALYKLIWQRAIACQMNPAIFDATEVDIKALPRRQAGKNYEFRATGSVIKFDGFLKVCPIKTEETTLPELKKNEILELIKLIPSQHFTQSPFPYTEATLVKALEENGIGRPSTYAPILETIQKRNYVTKRARYLYPTEMGVLVNNLLVEHFPKIVDVKFTAQMEEDLDEIARGKEKWVPVIKDFYAPFEKTLQEKYKQIDKKEITEEKTKEICEKCGLPMIIKIGRYGKFLACSGFPKCRNTKPIDTSIGVKCPKCSMRKALARPSALRNANAPTRMKDGEIVEKRTKKGKIFYGCSNYPKCDFALWDKPTGEKCPKCDSLLVKNRFNKVRCSNKECKYVKK